MRSLLPFLVSATLGLAAPSYYPSSGGSSSNGAIYFIQNKNGSANHLVAMPIEADGSLGEPVLTPSNGSGSQPISTLDTPAGVFFSQSSVTTGGNYIFSVNSGSNTLSMFAIDPLYPTRPWLVDVAHTDGIFPWSVTYSEYLQKACVLNAAGEGGVTCFKVSPKGLTKTGKTRSLYSKFKTTAPRPTGPSDSITQIMFNPGSTQLLVVVKGNPTTKPLTPGTFLSFPIHGTEIADEATETHIDDIVLNFGASYMSPDRLLVSSPTFGGAILEHGSNGSLVQTSKITVPDQNAICWTAFDQDLNYGYLYDAGRTTVEVVDGSSGKLAEPIVAKIPGNNGTEGGLFDTTIFNYVSYSLCSPNCVVALDLRSGRTVHVTDLSSLGPRVEFEGMASTPMYNY